MRHVVTLVARPGELAAADVDRLRREVAATGLRLEPPDWLTEATACDLGFHDDAPRELAERVRRAVGERPWDVAVVPVAGRRKRLLVADMESTVIRNEMLDELAAEIGLGERVAAITARAMNGELDFRAALAERVALLAGLDAAVLDRVAERIELDSGAATLVATLRAAGVHTALVSGGFHVFADPIAELLGFDVVRANRLEIAGGKLTGRVGEPILDRDAKLATLDELCAALGVGRDAAVTVGDGANDLPMLQAAGLGVAYRAKPSVAAAAPHRVEHGDLTALLYLQGYRAADLVS